MRGPLVHWGTETSHSATIMCPGMGGLGEYQHFVGRGGPILKAPRV